MLVKFSVFTEVIFLLNGRKRFLFWFNLKYSKFEQSWTFEFYLSLELHDDGRKTNSLGVWLTFR